MEKFYKLNLDKTYRIIGTNVNKAGVEYVSAMEAYSYPIYACMGHQEKAVYQTTPQLKYNKSRNAIRVAQAFMNFFVDECCKNDNHFATREEENSVVLQNYPLTYTAPLGFTNDEIYYFK